MIDFSSISSVSTAIHQNQMKAKFQLKKKSGKLIQKDPEENQKSTELDLLLEQVKKTSEQEKLSEITDKVAAGKKLTTEEMEYLKNHNQSLYQTVKQMEDETDTYKKELSSAKTKEEVQRIRTNHVMGLMTAVKSVQNTHMDEGMKTALYSAIQQKAVRDDKAYTRFVQSDDYQSLPTEEEVREAEKARREKLHPHEAQSEDRTEEQEDPVDSDSDTAKTKKTEETAKDDTDTDKVKEKATHMDSGKEEYTASCDSAIHSDGNNSLEETKAEDKVQRSAHRRKKKYGDEDDLEDAAFLGGGNGFLA